MLRYSGSPGEMYLVTQLRVFFPPSCLAVPGARSIHGIRRNILAGVQARMTDTLMVLSVKLQLSVRVEVTEYSRRRGCVAAGLADVLDGIRMEFI